MPEMEKWKYDRKLTATMVEDMLFNPVLGTRVLLGLKVPPHEEIRFNLLWTSFYTIDDSGFSTGKSFTVAAIAALRSMLLRDRVTGILSKTFAQGQLIFRNFDRWYESCSIFRNTIKHIGSKPRLVHGSAAWVMYVRGGSEVRVLPPNFLQDAERLRSERWNDGYFDEWTTFGKFEAFNKIVMGRITNSNRFPNCPVRQNHAHLSSTPAFTHDPAYRMVKVVNRHVASGNKDYGRFSSNYRHIPDTEEWQWLVTRKIIFQMQTTLPPGVVKSEVDGLWQADSLSYHSSRAISEVRRAVPVFTGRKQPSEVFVAGFDVARGGSTNRGGGDDFSVTVLRIDPDTQIPIHCYTTRKNNIRSKQMAAIIQRLHIAFGFSVIIYDPGGGGLFVRDDLSEDELSIRGTLTKVTPILEVNDASGAIGDQILVPFRRGAFLVDRLWGKLQSESVLINKLHQLVKGTIEQKRIVLASEWSGWENEATKNWDVEAKREFLNRAQGLGEDNATCAEMDIAVTQLMHVDVKRNDGGDPELDTFGMYKFLSKHKKDSAYSLIYSMFGVEVYKHMHAEGMVADKNRKSKFAIGRAIV